MTVVALPESTEHDPYYGKYISLLPATDVIATLEQQAISTAKLLAATPDAKGEHRYAEGKWSVKEVVGHVSDGERIFSYRALRFGRADTTELPGFDENLYVPAGRYERRTLADLAAELAAVRVATLALFRGFDPEALLRHGSANGQPVSVRALAAIIAGHERHHVALLRERYGLTG
jgi:hypothetical protein